MTSLTRINGCVRGARIYGGLGSALVLWLIFAEAQAQDFTYTTSDGTITITGSTAQDGFVGAVNIPSAINGLPVVSIAGAAFITNRFLTSVTIPGSVTNIGSAAFELCALTNVTISEGVITIGDSAFYGCWRLPNISIPNSVTSIGDLALNACGPLTNVIIGTGVTNIGAAALDECYLLSSVYFKGNAPTLNGSLFYYDTNETVYYLPGTTGWGATFAGAPTRLWNPQMLTTDGNFGVHPNGFGFNITGTAGIPLVVEAGTNLTIGPWTPLQSGTLTNGLISFNDPQWTNYPQRFYRIRSP